jgi:hypothetical protein
MKSVYNITDDLVKELEKFKDLYEGIVKKVKETNTQTEEDSDEKDFSKINMSLAIGAVAIVAMVAFSGKKDDIL